jgi:hypothetical protein
VTLGTWHSRALPAGRCGGLAPPSTIFAKLLRAAERLKLEGVVSKRRGTAYRSGDCRNWRKVKTAAWREANRQRWRIFERT